MPEKDNIRFREFDFSTKLDLNIDILHHTERLVKGLISQRDPSIQWVFQPYVHALEEMIEAIQEDQPVVYHNFTVIPELIYGMGILPYGYEMLAFICPTEYFAGYKDLSFTHNTPEHLCSLLSGTLGIALSNGLSKPDAMIYASHPCDSGVATCQALAEYYGVEPFIIDSPYDDSREAHDYVARQLKECVTYLEDKIGKKMDLNVMREAVRRSDRAHELLYYINELKKMSPCPIPSSIILRSVSVAMWGMAGSQETVSWLERFLEDARKRAEQGVGGRYEEKLRIAWIYTSPTFDPAIFEWMEARFGATSVIFQGAEHMYWPTYKPLRRPGYDYSLDELCAIMADKSLNTPMARQARGHFDYFIKDVVHWCREWKIDAAIFSGHIQCKSNWSSAQLAKEVLMDELGIPTLIYETDIFDPRVTSAEKTVAYMEPFLEMVAEMK